MELDSVMVRCGIASGDVRRLCRAGGEVWQEQGVVLDTSGRVLWRYAVVKLPARTAIQLGLIVPGAECGEIAEVVDGADGADGGAPIAGHPAAARAAAAARGQPPARQRVRWQRGPARPGGDAA